ncbi:hypothetical protein [Micromonospora sp. RTP1Z1]|nr:hypothetical protein [Micromonospora sp. RTP1Z1]
MSRRTTVARRATAAVAVAALLGVASCAVGPEPVSGVARSAARSPRPPG